jgi:hypothetical protein
MEQPTAMDEGGRNRGGVSSDSAIVDSLCARLVWSRLHEAETLKAKVDERTEMLARVERLRAEIEACVNANHGSALRLGQTCMAGQIESRHSATFSEVFTSFIRRQPDPRLDA